MDAVQEKDDSLVWYRNVRFQQRRVWLAMNSGVSDHGTCHSLKNDANAGEHVGLDKTDIMMNGAATSSVIREAIKGLQKGPATQQIDETELLAALNSVKL